MIGALDDSWGWDWTCWGAFASMRLADTFLR